MSGQSDVVDIGGHRVELSNLNKIFFKQAGISKGDVVDYYHRMAEYILPHLRDRPLSMQMFPDGLEGESFYQKRVPDHFPDWIDTVDIQPREGDVMRHVLVNNTASLVYLANQACLTFHPWLSRLDKLEKPDWLIFDLDPPEGGDFADVIFAAKRIRESLDERDMPSLLMTTGSKGLHVRVPLERRQDFDDVRAWAKGFLEPIADEHEDKLTLEVRKNKRKGRVFLDYLRNAYGQTAVAPYSIRARTHALVATPLDWKELDDKKLGPQSFHLENIRTRLGQKKDPWRDAPKGVRL